VRELLSRPAVGLALGLAALTPSRAPAQNETFRQLCQEYVQEGEVGSPAECEAGAAEACALLGKELGFPLVGTDPRTRRVVIIKDAGQCASVLRRQPETTFQEFQSGS
jgi:hypothetical protein